MTLLKNSSCQDHCYLKKSFFSIVFLHYLKAKTSIVHTPYVFFKYSTEYYEQLITDYRKFFFIIRFPNIVSTHFYRRFSSIGLLFLAHFPCILRKNAPTEFLDARNIWNISRCFCLFHDLVSLCWSPFMFRGKFFIFSLRRIQLWRCYFVKKKKKPASYR